MKIESFGATDIGGRCQNNQDSLLFDDEIGLYVVADGMGGHNAGEVASRLAVEMISGFVRRSREQERLTWPYGIDPQISYNGNSLRTAIMLANKRIWKEAESQEEYTGMGTTVVTALADEDTVTICHAGDSRVYRIRAGEMEQITLDDTWVQSAVEKGILQREQMRSHPLRNIITKAIGAEQSIEVPVLDFPLVEKDYYLLCSDGLHGTLQDAQMLEIITSAGDDLMKSVTSLIEAANAGGGRDNITALLLQCRM
jgi:serine/threonine protein phosphatase PrpC